MIQHLRKHTVSIKLATEGVLWAFKTQPNYRVHILLSLTALIFGILLKISYYEFLTVILLVVFGLVIETINTSIEQTTDAIDLKIREDIKIAKDVAAGAMLIFAIGSAVISCIIYVPKLLDLVNSMF